jgi:hypothetical protein
LLEAERGVAKQVKDQCGRLTALNCLQFFSHGCNVIIRGNPARLRYINNLQSPLSEALRTATKVTGTKQDDFLFEIVRRHRIVVPFEKILGARTSLETPVYGFYQRANQHAQIVLR